MLRIDLQAAGIPYRDERGRAFDFHSFRKHFATSLRREGIHPKIAQTLVRHSTISLTMDVYTNYGDDHEGAAAVELLPEAPKPLRARTRNSPPDRDRRRFRERFVLWIFCEFRSKTVTNEQWGFRTPSRVTSPKKRKNPLLPTGCVLVFALL